MNHVFQMSTFAAAAVANSAGVGVGFGVGVADELIIGQTTGAKGRLVYFANTNAARTAGVLKLIRVTTNGLGEGFAVGEPVVGGTSNATATVVTNTRPALKPFSGIVIYNENREPISRSPVQTEDFKITVRY